MKTISRFIQLTGLMFLSSALISCGGGAGGAGFEFTGYVEPEVGTSETLFKVTNTDPLLFNPANVIADFEDPGFIQNPANGWVVTGAFAEGQGWNALTAKLEGARIGKIAVSTCEINGKDCDGNVGSILTPAFTVNNDYINFLMSGGATPVGVQIRLAGTETVLLEFQPNSCSKPVLGGNDDWFHFDVRALKGQSIQLYIFDNETAGCGFVAFDHFYQSTSAFGQEAASAGEPTSGVRVTLPEDGISNIIGNFDDAVRMATSSEFDGFGWSATGAFANPQVASAWQGASAAKEAARIGDRAFSSCSTFAGGCASMEGTVTSPTFAVSQHYIYLLAAGGSASNENVAVEILRAATDEVLVSFTPKTCDKNYVDGDNDWFKVDVSAIMGQEVKVRVADRSTAECGFIAVDHIYQSNNTSFLNDAGETVTPKDGGVANIPEEFQSFNVSVAPDAFAEGHVVGNFNSALATLESGWVGTGAFANPADANAWQGTTAQEAAARVGESAASTCEMNNKAEGCDAAVGTLTSPVNTVIEDYLYFLMGGGNGAAPVGLRIMDSIGNVLHSYSPNSCGPSFIDDNFDWTAIDLSTIRNASVRFQLFDEEAGGCGFVSFDHLYQTARDPASNDGALPNPMINGGEVTLTNATLANLSFRTALPYGDSDSNVIGRFDTPQSTLDAGWVATGAFASSLEADAWMGTTRFDESARVGAGAVSTCEINANAEGCDAPVGTLTSAALTITAEQPKLAFLMAGGNGTAPVGLRVLNAADSSELVAYSPNSCGPSHISGDEDWVTLDLSDYVGTQVKIEVFDNEPGGCGFVSFDHVHFTNGEAYDPAASDDEEPVDPTSTRNVTVPADAFAQVIGNFDDAQATLGAGWTATGAFANPAAGDAWQGTTRAANTAAAAVGAGAVSTCEINGNADGCDAPVGTLTSPAFTVDAARTRLNFLMSGGNGTAPVGLRVKRVSDDSEVAAFIPNSCGPSHISGDDDWVTLDLAAHTGDSLYIEIYDDEAGGCGFLSFDHLHLSSVAAQLP
jgi:hypothetical protein